MTALVVGIFGFQASKNAVIQGLLDMVSLMHFQGTEKSVFLHKIFSSAEAHIKEIHPLIREGFLL